MGVAWPRKLNVPTVRVAFLADVEIHRVFDLLILVADLDASSSGPTITSMTSLALPKQ